MKVIARSGSSYLIEVGEGYGRVLDTDQERLFPVNAIASILARGYWEPFTGDPALLLERASELLSNEGGSGEAAGHQAHMHRL
jgi:hypothetical protein